MQCYFADFKDENDNLVFSIEDTHHLINVLRFKINDLLVAVYNETKYQIQVICEKPKLIGNIKNVLLENTELDTKITVIMPLLKQDRNDLIVQKATELGAFRIIGLNLKHNVVKIKNETDKLKKISRWQKIAREAAQQSNRNQIPKVSDIIKLDTISNYKSDLNLVANELVASQSLKFSEISKLTSITIVCGPEGGFSDSELLFLNSQNFQDVNLGQRILRSETALLMLLSNIVYQIENLN